MTEQAASFDALQEALPQGPDAVVEQLIDQLRAQHRYHELFEALKMRARLQAGLPLMQVGDETLSDPVRDKLEDGLFEACREVGTSLIRQGRVRDGWMYLRPVGDRPAAAKLLADIEPDEDSVEELVDVCLHEGVDVARGYSLVLEHYGTCNAITMFDTVVAQQPRAEQKIAAALLLEHLHQELLATVRADIGQQEGAEPKEATLAELVADRDWMFGEHSYHVDTTHLASTVRCARLLDDHRLLRLALDLTAYGRCLHAQFQYQGDEPFGEIYPSHALFFQALVGENSDEAVAYFRDKAEQLEPAQHGTVAVETYVDLLARFKRPADAIEALLRLMPTDIPPLGIAPSLFELCQQEGSYEPLLEHCRDANDLVGYATGLLHR